MPRCSFRRKYGFYTLNMWTLRPYRSVPFACQYRYRHHSVTVAKPYFKVFKINNSRYADWYGYDTVTVWLRYEYGHAHSWNHSWTRHDTPRSQSQYFLSTLFKPIRAQESQTRLFFRVARQSSTKEGSSFASIHQVCREAVGKSDLAKLSWTVSTTKPFAPILYSIVSPGNHIPSLTRK